MEILNLFLSNPAKDVILREQEESYGNTPLHIACSLHSFVLTKVLFLNGSDVRILNEDNKSPLCIIADEIDKYRGHLESDEK